ncbi:MAG TPA: zf-TFIIB domain-containing protein [Thermoanaerobaculia bacterium]|nr:zf-TFIIB domain-containing protein [Thermoanaerobaculia bacterium]
MTTDKPSKNEDEYFTRVELERKKQWEKERMARLSLEEKEKLKDLHYMKCPKCGMDLERVTIEGVSVEHCVSCSGIFLEQGELETILKHHEAHGGFHRVLSIFRS